MDILEEQTSTLRAEAHHPPVIIDNYKADGAEGNGIAFATVGDHENRPTDMTNIVVGFDGYNQAETGDVSKSLNNKATDSDHIPLVAQSWDGTQTSPTLTANNANGGQRMPDKDNFNAVLAYGLDRAAYNQGKNAQYDFSIDEDKIGPQTARGPGAVCARDYKGIGNQNDDHCVVSSLCARDYKGMVVRRLTPLECERLQGYPDYWTDIGDWTDSKGKTHKGDADAPRYKALGNSIALPFWQWLAKRIVSTYDRETTMASLFDGIGGFPLVFSRCGCQPIWASEIEEFPIAVTKKHFKDEILN